MFVTLDVSTDNRRSNRHLYRGDTRLQLNGAYRMRTALGEAFKALGIDPDNSYVAYGLTSFLVTHPSVVRGERLNVTELADMLSDGPFQDVDANVDFNDKNQEELDVLLREESIARLVAAMLQSADKETAENVAARLTRQNAFHSLNSVAFLENLTANSRIEYATLGHDYRAARKAYRGRTRLQLEEAGSMRRRLTSVLLGLGIDPDNSYVAYGLTSFLVTHPSVVRGERLNVTELADMLSDGPFQELTTGLRLNGKQRDELKRILLPDNLAKLIGAMLYVSFCGSGDEQRVAAKEVVATFTRKGAYHALSAVAEFEDILTLGHVHASVVAGGIHTFAL